MSLFVLEELSSSKVVVRDIKGVPKSEYSQEEFTSFDVAEVYCEDKLEEHGIEIGISGDRVPF